MSVAPSIGTSTASMNAAAPTMESQQQQARYADANRTRGALQMRDGDPMDFGVIPFARDPYDERAAIIRDISSDAPSAANDLLGIPHLQVQRTLPITDQDIEYVHRWEAQQQELMFDKWIMSQFDMTKPAERDRVMKLFPRYQQRQKALVDSKLALMKKWIDIQMFGIRSEEDGRFLYNVNAGVIQLPKSYYNYDALTTALNPYDPEGTTPPGFGGKLTDRGWFNPLRYIGVQTARNTAGYNTANPAYPIGYIRSDRNMFGAPTTDQERYFRSTRAPAGTPTDPTNLPRVPRATAAAPTTNFNL